RLAEIDRNHFRLRPAPAAQLARERVQPLASPRDQQHVEPAPRELARKLLADTGRRARHQRPGTVARAEVRGCRHEWVLAGFSILGRSTRRSTLCAACARRGLARKPAPATTRARRPRGWR